MPPPPPNMPGIKAPYRMAEQFRWEVARLLGRDSPNFPGSQPVSFARRHIEELQKEDYYVCEKSDGIRCLMYFAEGDNGKEIHYLIDRRNDYYYVPDLHFPIPGDETFQRFHIDTLIDGELVIDEENDRRHVMKYLVFDCLVLDGRPLMHRTLDKRLGYLREHVYAPYRELCGRFAEEVPYFPFLLEFKRMQVSYAIEMMFRDILPNLKHGNDGLIFTCRNSPYKIGTDDKILKWKPASENSIDFRLSLQFPILSEPEDSEGEDASDPDSRPVQYDYEAMPTFTLSVYMGGRDYRGYSTLYMEPQEWEDMKKLGIPLDDTIVECAMDEQKRWRFKRFRNDKKEANHISTVESVMESIRDAVDENDLRDAAKPIKDAWKTRLPQTTGQVPAGQVPTGQVPTAAKIGGRVGVERE